MARSFFHGATMATLDCTAGNLNLVLTSNRAKSFTVTATGFDSTGCKHKAQFRETPDLDSLVLFTLDSEGVSPQITQSSGTNSTITFQILAANTAALGGRSIYWSWKIIFADNSEDDWLAGLVTINETPTQ